LTPCHFGLSPPCGFLRPFCIGAAEEGGNRQGKESVKVPDGYQFTHPQHHNRIMSRGRFTHSFCHAAAPHGSPGQARQRRQVIISQSLQCKTPHANGREEPGHCIFGVCCRAPNLMPRRRDPAP
jgi:hypothetical protein